MSEHQDIDGMVTSLLGGPDTPARIEHGRAHAHSRLDDAIAGRAPQRQHRRSARPPLAVALACGFVLVSGVAVAATTGVADRILGSTAPAGDRIQVLRDDPRPAVSQDEVMDSFRAATVKEDIGDRLRYELSPPLVQDDRARLSARRTANGDVCTSLYGYVSLKPSEPAQWRPAAAGCGAFQDGWPLMESVGSNTFAGSLSYGLVADGVAKVRFVVDGETLDAKLGDGAFLWRNPRDSKPSDIEAVLDDGTIVRRDLTWLYDATSYGPPSKPHVVN